MSEGSHRPRRSMLYTPATRPDRVEKALTMDDGPDMVVADLEDAVPLEEKTAAREGIVEVVREATEDARAERCIRVNGTSTRWFMDDVTEAVSAEPDTVVVPKVEAPGQLRTVDGRLAEAENEHELSEGEIEVIVQLETARGVAHAVDIAQAGGTLPRVTGLVFGAEDYAADVGARRTRSDHEVSYARQRVVLAAAVGSLQPIDQVQVDYEDAEALAEEAQLGRELGYVGKQIIHPAQIEPVHEAFTPSEAEIDEARELLAAVEEADILEGGVISYEGRMIDRPLIEQARRVDALATRLGL